ncbi:MAG: hypothetical protein WC518_01530 [Patescibacteria group bacterium]
MAKAKKPRLAIIGLTSCEGCQFSMLDKGRRFLGLMKNFQVKEFRLVEDEKMLEENFDLCLVEGNPVTKENIRLLKEMRRRSKLLVVIGNCAALGGVWELKNYQNKKKTIRQVYKKIKVANPDIKEVDNFVKVDFTIPGCPIDGEEFMELAYQLLSGRIPKIPQNPVCHECQTRGYECLLQQGEICLGPITLGGCRAVCLKSRQACWGCRGLFEGARVENLMKELLSKFPREQVYRVMEVFGARDSILKELEQEEKPAEIKNVKLKVKNSKK